MLVPERGDPTTKTGLFMLRCIQPQWIIRLFTSSQALSIFTVGTFFSKDILALYKQPIAITCWGGISNSHLSEPTSDVPCAG